MGFLYLKLNKFEKYLQNQIKSDGNSTADTFYLVNYSFMNLKSTPTISSFTFRKLRLQTI